MRIFTSAVCSLLVLFLAVPSSARNTVVFFGFNPGFHWYDTNELIIDKDPNTPEAELIPSPGFQPELRLGLNIEGYAGLEAFIAGHWWGDRDDEYGGGGVAGGLVRFTPLEIFQYLWSPMDKRFVDVGLSFGAGYTIVGEDFAYQGWFLQYGFDVNFFVFPFLAVGFEFPIRQMLYQPFRYTHLGNRKGLYTQGGRVYDKDDHEVVRTAPREVKRESDGKNIGVLEVDPQEPNKVTGNYVLTEIDAADMNRYDAVAPEVWHYTPMLKITFLVDFGDVTKFNEWFVQ